MLTGALIGKCRQERAVSTEPLMRPAPLLAGGGAE